MNRKILEIMEDMDRLDEVEITDELIDVLKDHFKEEIESEKEAEDKDENEKVAKGAFDNQVGRNKGNTVHGQSDRI